MSGRSGLPSDRRADTGEIVHSRLRGGSSQKGNTHFVAETINRVRRAGATGELTVRADAGFWSYEMIDRLDRLGVKWSITVPLYSQVKKTIKAIPESEWISIDYPQGGMAQIAETTFRASSKGDHRLIRLVVRRTRLTDPDQAQLWPDWRHHAFATNTGLGAVDADQDHRAHARAELAIRDLKNETGLDHLPSANFYANAAWLACATLAHNLYRWIAHHNGARPTGRLVNGRTIRTRLLSLPGRLVNHSGQIILRLPARWPWATTYQTTLHNIRGLPQLC